MCSDSPKIVGQKPSVKFFRVAPYVEVNSLTFEEAGCLKKHPATSKGGRPHSDIASVIRAYQTISKNNPVEILGAIALLL